LHFGKASGYAQSSSRCGLFCKPDLDQRLIGNIPPVCGNLDTLSWTKEIGSAAEAERELSLHIERVVSRYRGKIKIWHVVNEPIDDAKGAVAELRPSIWLQHLGVKYIDTAFRLAHEADPAAELVINEYDIECVGEQFSARRQALLTLVRDLRARGVPLHGVGLQGPIKGKYQIDDDGLYNFIAEIKALGLSVHVTELDVIDKGLSRTGIRARRHRGVAGVRFSQFHICRHPACGDHHLGYHGSLYVGARVVQAQRRLGQSPAAFRRVLSAEAAVVGDRLFLSKERLAGQAVRSCHEHYCTAARSPN
jgi:hypothetical protein